MKDGSTRFAAPTTGSSHLLQRQLVAACRPTATVAEAMVLYGQGEAQSAPPFCMRSYRKPVVDVNCYHTPKNYLHPFQHPGQRQCPCGSAVLRAWLSTT